MNVPTMADIFRYRNLQAAEKPLFNPEDMEKTAALASAASVANARDLVESLLASASDQLFDISLTDILLGAWTKVREIQAFASGDKLIADKTHKFTLSAHKVTSKHKPKIELFVYDNKVKEVTLDVALSLLVAKTTLLIRQGRIIGINLSGCHGSGKVSYQGWVLLERKSAEVKFSGDINLGDGIKIPPPLTLKKSV